MNCIFRHIEKQQEESIKSLKKRTIDSDVLCLYIKSYLV